MKKQITAIITAALILTNFTACSAEKEPINNSSNNSSETFDNSGNEIENSSTESSAQSTPESVPESIPETVSEVVELVPVEFTDEDRKLQEILSELAPPAREIHSWLIESIPSAPFTEFKFPQFGDNDSRYYGIIPENCYWTDPDDLRRNGRAYAEIFFGSKNRRIYEQHRSRNRVRKPGRNFKCNL